MKRGVSISIPVRPEIDLGKRTWRTTLELRISSYEKCALEARIPTRKYSIHDPRLRLFDRKGGCYMYAEAEISRLFVN